MIHETITIHEIVNTLWNIVLFVIGTPTVILGFVFIMSKFVKEETADITVDIKDDSGSKQ